MQEKKGNEYWEIRGESILIILASVIILQLNQNILEQLDNKTGFTVNNHHNETPLYNQVLDLLRDAQMSSGLFPFLNRSTAPT